MTPAAAIAAAERWLEADPDPETRLQLQALVHAAARDAAASQELCELMGGALAFGTAGLRAVVGPGPLRMNRAVIRRTTAGVARHLLRKAGAGALAPVVVGADARPSSAAFLREAVGVLAAYGLPVRFFREPVATPIAAYVAQRLGAAAAIVITASHNPPAYNGYKLYGAGALQIAAAEEAEVEAELGRSLPANEEPWIESAGDGGSALAEPLAESWRREYVADVVRLLNSTPVRKDLRVAYTPLHGVGYAPFSAVFSAAGFADMHAVAEQREPDGTFPTLRFPNPEEPGTLDLLLALAASKGADLALANDPDADRLAAALPDGKGGWLPLTGNQIGVLLADFLLEAAPRSPTPLLVQSIVSSPMLGSICQAQGARLERTLTGFKWIWTAALALCEGGQARFVFGYEEALGYSVSSLVRDKDGISAALALAELAALEKARGSSLRERLERLFRRHGLWVSAQRNVTREGPAGAQDIADALNRLSNAPPDSVGAHRVSSVVDYRSGGESRPPWLPNAPLLELLLGPAGRVLVRPSGTEPKLKIYVDLACTAPSGDLWPVYAQSVDRAARLGDELLALLGLG